MGLAGAAVLVAAVAKTHPQGRFRAAWRSLDAWRTRCPPKQAPAMPLELAMAVVGWLTINGRPRIGAAVLLAYSGLLRASEALQLTWSDLIWSKLGLTLRLGQTKRGQEQRVVLTNPSVLHWMRRFYARCSGLSSDRVVGCGYGTLLRWLRKATAALGWADVPWTTHSLRRGGASELVLAGMPISDLLEFG